VLRQRLCRGCEAFARKNPVDRCHTCARRAVPVEAGVCRLCRRQASLIAGPECKIALDLTVAASTGQQLFLAGFSRAARTRSKPSPSLARPVKLVAPAAQPKGWEQPILVDAARHCRRASSLDPPRDPAFLQLVLRHADVLAEHNGWPRRTLQQVRRGLRMIASCHEPDEPVKASTITAMSPHGVPGLRVLEVLFAAGDGLVVDDRADSLTVWIDAKFASLPPRMRDELDTWITVLRHGTPRRRARPRITTFTLLAAAHPFLTEITDRYITLRQVTRQDVLDWLDDRKHRTSDAHALRDLFGVLKAQRRVFANPLTRIHIGSANPSTPAALTGEALQAIGDAAKNDPTLQTVVALIGVHALRPHQVRTLTLEQIDIPDQRIDLGTARRRLDPFTAAALAAYLNYRHQRWPDTGNQHLLLTRRTAHERGPVSAYWLTSLFDGLPVTAADLREDRFLEEARAANGDPLHIAAMFGLTAKPALRYARPSGVSPDKANYLP
jgi:integrase